MKSMMMTNTFSFYTVQCDAEYYLYLFPLGSGEASYSFKEPITAGQILWLLGATNINNLIEFNTFCY